MCAAGGMHAKEGGCAWHRGAFVAGQPATAADGTHPTGMHSCFTLCKHDQLYVMTVMTGAG